jgi:hypothetical protein
MFRKLSLVVAVLLTVGFAQDVPDPHFGTRCVRVNGPSGSWIDVCAMVNTDLVGGEPEGLARIGGNHYDGGASCYVIWDYVRLRRADGANLKVNESNDNDPCSVGENHSTAWANDGNDLCNTRMRVSVEWNNQSFDKSVIVDSYNVYKCGY